MRKDSPLYTILFAFIISALFALLLGAVNAATRDTILLKQKIVEEKAILEAAGISTVGMSDVEVDTLFREKVKTVEYSQKTIYLVKTDKGQAFAFKYSGPGLWGTIYAIIAVDESLTRLAGISFTKQSETPGLGGRIDESWFKMQFRGETIHDTYPFIKVQKSSRTSGDLDHTNASVDAITGATQTSNAVEKLINEGLKEYIPILKALKAGEMV